MVWPEYGGYKPGDKETWGATQHVNAGAWLGVVVCVVLQVCGSRGPGGATTVKPGHQGKPDSLTPLNVEETAQQLKLPQPLLAVYAAGAGERQSPVPPATSHRETDLCPVLALGPGLRRYAQGNHPVRRRVRCGALSHWDLSVSRGNSAPFCHAMNRQTRLDNREQHELIMNAIISPPDINTAVLLHWNRFSNNVYRLKVASFNHFNRSDGKIGIV